MRGVPRERRAISSPASSARPMPSSPADRRTIVGQRLGARRSRAGARCRSGRAAAAASRPGPRRRADQRERRQRQPHRARRRPLADHEVEREVLERRVEDLGDRRRQAVDLVDEQHAARLEVGEDRGEVAGALEHRPRGHLERHAHLGGDDVRQRRLAEPRRAEQQHVVERLRRRDARRGDEHAEVGGDLLLADVLGEPPRPQALLEARLGRVARRPQHML